jgi:hypothetical protein
MSSALPEGLPRMTTRQPEIVERAEQPYVVLGWAADRGLHWDQDGERWGCRLEVLYANPREEPDPSGWRTDLVYRLADG